MMKYSPTKTITYDSIEGFPLEADFFEATANIKNKTILYYHGGGLIYGTRKDLPLPYLTGFLEAGYHVLTVDYPLTPETSFEDMMDKVSASLTWFIQEGVETLQIESNDYILFGRSAGAYLVSYLTKKVTSKKPSHLILLYGYYDLEDIHLIGKSSHYNKMMKIDSRQFYSLIQPNPITSGQVEKRYLMYLYLRQTGTWPFLREDLRKEYSLKQEDFKDFPKTFLAFSHDDVDVPPTQSSKMITMIPDTKTFTVDHEEHDFDRDPTKEVSKNLYREIISWLDE